MVEVIKQRKYIQDFLDFVGSFLITEDVTISEFDLVEKNLEILRERIQTAKVIIRTKDVADLMRQV